LLITAANPGQWAVAVDRCSYVLCCHAVCYNKN